MNYNEALSYTHSLLRFGSRPGMERITALLNALGNPQRSLRVVHIAGTNGKGSVCSMLNSVLISAGYKTGLFESPYIVDFRERIQVNSEFIPEADYAEICTRVRAVSEKLPEGLQPTEFEFVTAAAFVYFYNKKCDVVVLETGLGGLLDSTNVCDKPLATVITSVSMDHMAVLGATLAEIAAQKAGILKAGCPAVTSPKQSDEVLCVIAGRCAELGITLHIPAENSLEMISDTLDGHVFSYANEEYALKLVGTFQPENALLALETLNILREKGFDIPVSAVKTGLKNAKHPARFEVFRRENGQLIILDGAHNQGGISALYASLEKYLPDTRLFGICGVLADKDFSDCFDRILPRFDGILTVTPANPRALQSDKLCEKLKGKVPFVMPEKVDNTLIPKALELCKGKPLLIFGSLYLAGEIYKFI